MKWFPVIVISAAALSLAGCFTPPNANVQPKGQLGLIQDGIIVESVQDPATVQAIDAGQDTITLALPSGTTMTYRISSKVKHFNRIQIGDKVQAKVSESLAVYVLENGRLPDGSTAESLGVNAKVQQVDPSYRLLTLQYPNGQTDTVKPGLHTKMQLMSPGDSVVIRPGELRVIEVEKP